MSVPLVIRGVTYNYPQQGDTNWGPTLTAWSTAVTNVLAQFPSPGVITLSPYPTAAIKFANDTNTGFLPLAINGSNQLTFNGTPLNTLSLPVSVSNGGTGDSSLTAYSVLCGGTTATGNIQSVSGLGLVGQALVSNGAAALPTWQNVAGSGTVNTGTAGYLAMYRSGGTTISDTFIQNISGNYSFAGGQISIFNIPNQLFLSNSNGNGVLINGGSPAGGNWIINIPDSGTNTSFVLANGASTINSVKTFTSPPTIPNGVASTDATAFGQVQYGFQNASYTQTQQQATVGSVTFTSVGLSLSFTPTSVSNRVKLTVCGSIQTANLSTVGTATIFRGSTNLAASSATDGFALVGSTATGALTTPVCMTVIDAPATTSALTYTIRIRSNGSGNVVWGPGTVYTTVVIEELR